MNLLKIYKIEIENASKTNNLYFKFNLSSSFKNKMNSNSRDKYFREMIRIHPILKRYFIPRTTRYFKWSLHKLTNSRILLSFKILIYFRVGIIFAFFRTRRLKTQPLHARGVINNKRAQQSPFSSYITRYSRARLRSVSFISYN